VTTESSRIVVRRPKAQAPRKALAISKNPAKGKTIVFHQSKEIRPNDIIPMDEIDFKDF